MHPQTWKLNVKREAPDGGKEWQCASCRDSFTTAYFDSEDVFELNNIMIK